MKTVTTLIAAVATLVPALSAGAGDWPMWGRDSSRNMSTPHEKNLPVDFFPGEFVGASDRIDRSTTRNIKWIAKLGSQSYGNPVVANGRVYVGTNNDSPRDPRFKGDRSVVYCCRREDRRADLAAQHPQAGDRQGQRLGVPRDLLIAGGGRRPALLRHQPLRGHVRSTSTGWPTATTVRSRTRSSTWRPGEAADGGHRRPTPTSSGRLNMIDECGVFPHNITSSSVVVTGDQLWVSTSNGVDYGHVETPAPNRAVPDPRRQEHRQAPRRGGLGAQPAHLPLQLDLAGLPQDRRHGEHVRSSAVPTAGCTPSCPSRPSTTTASSASWSRSCGASTPTSPSTACKEGKPIKLRDPRRARAKCIAHPGGRTRDRVYVADWPRPGARRRPRLPGRVSTPPAAGT